MTDYILAKNGAPFFIGSTEELLEELISRWATLYPHEVVQLREKMKVIRQHMNEKGLGENTLYKGEIPESLSIAIANATHRQWRQDPDIRNPFWRLFAIGRVNHTSESQR